MIIQAGQAYIDDETGEVLGLTDTHTLQTDGTLKRKFRVHDEATATWFLKKMMEFDLELARIKAEEEAIIQNIQAMRKRAESNREWLTRRYTQEFKEFLETYCQGKKTKSFQTPFGFARMMRIQPSLSVAPGKDTEAIEWCESYCPDAVKVKKTVLVTPIKEFAKTSRIPLNIFDSKPESERLYIDTGVNKKQSASEEG